MTVELPKAVVTRWNAAGLNTSLGPLRPGGTTIFSRGDTTRVQATQQQMTFGGLPESELPRYEYLVSFAETHLRGSQSDFRTVPVVFFAWTNSYLKSLQDLDTIEAAYVDSEWADSSPFTISNSVGKVLAVNYGGHTVVRADRQVWVGVLQLEVEWSRLRPVYA